MGIFDLSRMSRSYISLPRRAISPVGRVGAFIVMPLVLAYYGEPHSTPPGNARTNRIANLTN